MSTKFRLPMIRQPVLLRDRLLDLMSEAVRGPLTLISAPAGSGKTVLVSSWASVRQAPGPMIWVSLDEEDDRPGVFWAYVLAGMARNGVPITQAGTPEAEDDVDHLLLVRLAACLSEQPAPVVLILDNAEVLNRHQIADQLDFVIRHAAGQLRLVFIARIDPNLPLHQYRLDGSVTEIRFAELAFTTKEARELLRGQDIGATDDTVDAFTYRTRGWAAGLRLASSCIEQPDDAGLVESDIAAYFRSEVLETQAPGVREFLLSTSVVDHLPAELAVHLSGRRDASTTLRALALANTFVEQPADEGECYHYHPLVLDLLRAELRQESVTKERRLHRRAARWLEAAGRSVEAACQYAAAQDWRDAARLVVRGLRIGRLLVASPSDSEVAALAAMPATTTGPEAAVVSAAFAWRDRAFPDCEKHLNRAEELLAEGGIGEDVRSVRLAVAVMSGLLADWSGDADGVLATAPVAREILSELAVDGVDPLPQISALIGWSTGCAHLGLGELQKARSLLAVSARTANVPGGERLRGECLATLALAEALSGRLTQASGTAHRALGLAGRCEPHPGMPAAELALAWVSAHRGDCAGARAYLERATVESAPLLAPTSRAVAALVNARLLQVRGDLAGALSALEEGRKTQAPVRIPTWLTTRLCAASACLLTTQGRVEEAMALVRGSGSGESPELRLAGGWADLTADPIESLRVSRQVSERPGLALDVRIGAVLLAAAAELEMGRQEAARASVGHAVGMAEREGLWRPFEEVPPRLRMILRGREDIRAQWRASNGTPHGRSRTSRTGPPDSGTGVPVQPLTERETEVLRYLAELLATDEIAARMFVSVNTVKSHVRAILRKLSAARRNEAVRRGRELGLF